VASLSTGACTSSNSAADQNTKNKSIGDRHVEIISIYDTNAFRTTAEAMKRDAIVVHPRSFRRARHSKRLEQKSIESNRVYPTSTTHLVLEARSGTWTSFLPATLPPELETVSGINSFEGPILRVQLTALFLSVRLHV